MAATGNACTRAPRWYQNHGFSATNASVDRIHLEAMRLDATDDS